MTKEEALVECADVINCSDDWCRPKVEIDLTRLRAFGYIVIAVEPDEAEIEAMAVDAVTRAEAKAARAAMIAHNEPKS